MLEVLDPRPRLDEAAQLAARYGNTGWHVAETLVAGLAHGHQLWFGDERNVGDACAKSLPTRLVIHVAA